MFSPKYRILIRSKNFPGDGVIGLGTQLISIISSVKSCLEPHIWFAADVEAVGKGVTKYDFSSTQLKVIGNDLQFVEYCSEIEQFIWGVFVCVDEKLSHSMQSIELETEDKSFRSINANGILMEIRAFDTTYFGVYTDDLDLILKISSLYSIGVEKNKKNI